MTGNKTRDAAPYVIVRMSGGWYTVQRIVEADGKSWGVVWALPHSIPSKDKTRDAARRAGLTLRPDVYEEPAQRRGCEIVKVQS